VQPRNRAVESPLSLGAARDREINLANLFYYVVMMLMVFLPMTRPGQKHSQ
jgi:preprotein translocase subunit YajC